MTKIQNLKQIGNCLKQIWDLGFICALVLVICDFGHRKPMQSFIYELTLMKGF